MTTLTRSISNDLEFWAELDALFKANNIKQFIGMREWQAAGLAEMKRRYQPKMERQAKAEGASAKQKRIEELEKKLKELGGG